MKQIELAHGRGTTVVDDEDYEWLSQHQWRHLGRGYASTKINGVTTLMHRLILGVQGRHNQVDHINGDKLDNRRNNLRRCTNAENHRNMAKMKRRECQSRFKGVGRVSTPGIRWYAHIRSNYKTIHLGCFASEEEAARVYNEAAIRLFGKFAKLNEIPQEDSCFRGAA